MRIIPTVSSLVALTAASAALAQEAQPVEGQQIGSEVQVLSDWSYDPIYSDGWSVERLFDETEVYGADGEVIGGVENVILSDSGEVLSLIAEVGGFWDIGDTHVAVPWDEVELAPMAESLTIPVDVDNVAEYSIFGDAGASRFSAEVGGEDVERVDEELIANDGVFKATDLIGDYAYLTGGDRYGYVNDLVIMDGKLSAVVIEASGYGTPGYYAFPYAGYGADDWRYDLPYGADEVATIDTFDYDRMQRGAMSEDSAG